MGAKEKVTQELWEEVKTLLKYEVSMKEIATRTGISSQTVSVIGRTESHKQYREWATEHLDKLYERKKQKQIEQKQNDDNTGEFYRFNQIIGTLREQNKILMRIAEAAEKIAQEL